MNVLANSRADWHFLGALFKLSTRNYEILSYAELENKINQYNFTFHGFRLILITNKN